jgi:hypothetical protein
MVQMLGWFSAEAARASSAKAFQRLLVLGSVFRQEFQGDESPEFSILCLVDDAHPASTKFLQHLVVRDNLPNELGGCAHCRECYDANNGRSMLFGGIVFIKRFEKGGWPGNPAS